MQSCYKLAVVLAALMLMLLPVEAKVKVSQPTIRQGGTLRVQRYSVAILKCKIANPDPKPHKVMLRLLADSGYSGNQKNFYSDVVAVPAKTEIIYETPVVVETSEKYSLEAYMDGQKLYGGSDSTLLKLLPIRSFQIGMLNDSGERSFGSFNQLPEFKKKVFTMSMAQHTFPENWLPLRELQAIVVVEPDLKDYTAAQYQALLDYVYQGGTVIFANPEILPEIAKTPWADLLPVQPVRIRKIKDLPVLKKLVPGFRGWDSHQAAFLESQPLGDGVTLMADGEFPVFRWKKYGLGSCRFSAISICDKDLPDKKVWTSLCKYFVNNPALYANEEEFNQCLDEMTGFPVPELSVVKGLLLAYFILLALVLIAGKLIRRSGLAWMCGAILAMLFTYYVLNRSGSGKGPKGKILSALEITYPGNSSIPKEGYYAFFSDSDGKVNISMPETASVISSIPPDRLSLMRFSAPGQKNKPSSGMAVRITKSLVVQRKSGMPVLDKMAMSKNSSRQFRLIAAETEAKPENQTGQAKIVFGGKPFKFTKWKIPAGEEFEYALLMLPNRILNLTREGDYLTLSGSGEVMFSSDVIMNAVRGCLTEAVRKSSPALVLVGRLKETSLKLPENTMVQGRKLKIYPVSEVCDGTTVELPADMVVLSSGDTSARMIMPGNFLKNQMESRGAITYCFKFQVPPVFSRIKPDEIKVELAYSNPGGNIKLTPCLAEDGRENPSNRRRSRPRNKWSRGSQVDESAVKGKMSESGAYVFSGEEIAKAIDPLTGTGYLIISADEIKTLKNAAQKNRGNKWGITKLKVSVKGKLPEGTVPFDY